MLDNIKNKLKDYNPYINGSDKMKKASVLIPIVKQNSSYHILFEVRSSTLNSQPNEISFPGGKIESNESPLNAAIRETCEEIGTISKNIEIISSLDLLIHPNNLIIHPYVGIISDINNLDINKDEVDHIFLVPITYLLETDADVYESNVEMFPSNDFPFDLIPNKENYKFAKGTDSIYFYKYNNYVIWGITAKILENFLNLIIE